METAFKQFKVTKSTDIEIDNLKNFINDLEAVLESNGDCNNGDSDKEIADIAKKLPSRSYLIPINCQILIDNFQDKDKECIEIPEWITQLYDILSDVNSYLNTNQTNQLFNSEIHEKIKTILKP